MITRIEGIETNATIPQITHSDMLSPSVMWNGPVPPGLMGTGPLISSVPYADGRLSGGFSPSVALPSSGSASLAGSSTH